MDGTAASKATARMTPKTASKEKKKDAGHTSTLVWLAYEVFMFAYGFFTLVLFLLLAFTQKRSFMKLSKTDKKDLAAGMTIVVFHSLQLEKLHVLTNPSTFLTFSSRPNLESTQLS
jgi:hypothetical protein